MSLIQVGEWLLSKPLASKRLFHSSTLGVGLALMLFESFNADNRLDQILLACVTHAKAVLTNESAQRDQCPVPLLNLNSESRLHS